MVGEADNCFIGYELALTLLPNVIIMDLMDKTSNSSPLGIGLIKKIKSDFPNIQVIVLSNDKNPEDIRKAFCSGANGYLLKSSSIEEIKDSIFNVFAGNYSFSPSLTKDIISIISSNVKRVDTIKTLSECDIKILNMIAHGATNKGVAKELFLSVRTIESHIHTIFQKLHVNSRSEAVAKAIGNHLI